MILSRSTLGSLSPSEEAGEGKAEACLLAAVNEVLQDCLLALYHSDDHPKSPTWEFLERLQKVAKGQMAVEVKRMVNWRELDSFKDQASFWFSQCMPDESHPVDVSTPFRPLHMEQQIKLRQSARPQTYFEVLAGCTAVPEADFGTLLSASADAAKAPVRLLEVALKTGWAQIDDPHKRGLRTVALVHRSDCYKLQCLRFGGDHGHHTFVKLPPAGQAFLVKARVGASLRCCACPNCQGAQQKCADCGKDFVFELNNVYIADPSIDFALCSSCSSCSSAI